MASVDDRVVDDRVWRRIRANVAKASRATVAVGIEAGELADIGMMHEYGTKDIPQRSWMRQTFALRRANLIALQARIAAGIMAGTMNPKTAMGLLGAYMSGAIKATITSDGNFAPLAPATIRAKGSSKPLIETGSMVGAITWKVID